MFSKPKPSPGNGPETPLAAPPVARSSGTRGASFSVIGDGITITGNIHAEVDLHVDGKVDGDIVCASLVQGPTSVIKGAIIAQSASLSGTVEGSIDAGELVIAASARITGDVGYEKLQIEQGGHVDGQFRHKVHQAGKPAAPAARAGETTLLSDIGKQVG